MLSLRGNDVIFGFFNNILYLINVAAENNVAAVIRNLSVHPMYNLPGEYDYEILRSRDESTDK